MKYLFVGITFMVFFAAASGLMADKVYTWTDENGNLHITEQPPPKNARVKDVIQYKPEAEKTIQQQEQREDLTDKALEKKRRLQEARQARADAEKARQQAGAARVRAQETARRSEEFIKTHDTNQYMRIAFKYKIKKAAEDARLAEEQARLAEKKAAAAEKKAELAEQRLKEIVDEPSALH